jgi:lipocalin
MKKKLLFSGLILCFSVFISCKPKPMSTLDLKPAENFELERYLGTWYEIARFQHSFEKDLVGVTAKYSLRDDGNIRVVNSGYKGSFSGKYKSISGKARIPDPSKPAHLQVSFFLFFYSDYYVLEIDSIHYGYALVGSSSENYLWILGRTPSLPDEVYNLLLSKARERGYDVGRLFKVPQVEKL